MTHYHDFQSASPQLSIQEIGRQLEQLRLSKNLSQSVTASEAGVSRRTITRMEAGETVSLDTFVRVLKVYGVADRLAALFPLNNVRPIERAKLGGKQRKRASSIKKTTKKPNDKAWSWGDDESNTEQDD